MYKNIGKNISKNLSGKYRQKLIDQTKQSATDALKTISKRVIQKTEEATDLTGNKIAEKNQKSFRLSINFCPFFWRYIFFFRYFFIMVISNCL